MANRDVLPTAVQRLIPQTIDKGIYYRLYPRQDGSVSLKWWVKVWKNGKPICQSSDSERYSDALDLRNRLIAEMETGKRAGGKGDQVRLAEILDDYIDACKAGEATKKEYSYSANRIKQTLGRVRVIKLTTDKLNEYRKERVAEIVAKKNPKTEEQRQQYIRSANTTVNRDFALMSAAMYYGKDQMTPAKVLNVPHFPRTKEDNARQGFLETDKYEALRDAFADPGVRLLFIVGFNLGCRSGELRQIEWSMVDLAEGVIRLPGRITKNGKPRTVPIFEGDMMESLKAEKQQHDEFYPESPWVFSRLGDQIKDFRHEWAKATEAAECPDVLFHDLRRTAVRNMKRLHDLDNATAMKISGHLTDSMFRRYDIIDEADIKRVKAKVDSQRSAPGTLSTPQSDLMSKLLTVPEDKLKAMLALLAI